MAENFSLEDDKVLNRRPVSSTRVNGAAATMESDIAQAFQIRETFLVKSEVHSTNWSGGGNPGAPPPHSDLGVLQ